MVNLDRKTTILSHIQKYCVEIDENFKFFGTQLETFKKNNILEIMYKRVHYELSYNRILCII